MVRLTIAEKPQDAAEIARVLGAHTRASGYFYGERDIVTWVVGHLVELYEPQDYDPQLAVWRRETLPIIPNQFQYRVISNRRAQEQFAVIKTLLARSDVHEVINACDAAREGELIFDLVCRMAGNVKPCKRLWMESKTDNDILTGYSSLRPSSEYAGLLAAAYARSEGDWLIGFNGTRAMSLAASNGLTYSLGRVITPTVALVVIRDEAIENFVPVSYFEITAKFRADAGTYTGYHFVPPAPKAESQEKRIKRFESHAAANAIALQLPTSARVVTMTEKEVEIKQPLFYDLTQLQREANIRFGLSAQATLDAAQILWDAKLITYPRSASQHISTTINEQIDKHLDALVDITDESFAHLASGARLVKERGYALTKRHVDDKKLLEGHYGILPSGETPDFTRLPNAARQLYDLIGRRFIAAFFPPARDARTEIITACGEHQFLTRGVRELVSGWRSIDPPSRVVEEKAEADTDEQIGVLLPKVTRGESVQRIDSQKLSKKTRAPQRYTEASLLEAMESAGQHCETEEERLAMKVCGLGMPSTRASTIRRAFELHYFEHEGKRYVRSTAVAREVIRRLRAFNSLLVSPAMTGKWEAVLARIAAGERDARSFRQSVVELTRKLVAEILGSVSADVESNDAFQSAANVGECPQCKVAGRSGRLRVCSGKGGKFFGCQLPRDVCGYISDFTQKSKELKALIKKRCPDDGRAMRLRHGKKTETPYLSCTGYPDCKRVVFFEEKVKQARPAAAKSKLKERLPSNAAT